MLLIHLSNTKKNWWHALESVDQGWVRWKCILLPAGAFFNLTHKRGLQRREVSSFVVVGEGRCIATEIQRGRCCRRQAREGKGGASLPKSSEGGATVVEQGRREVCRHRNLARRCCHCRAREKGGASSSKSSEGGVAVIEQGSKGEWS
ncbi:hypothetical protein Pint_15866 [Pistacia integerrima]|uniref:Uncharacterized protein n=1 Tax=Pistacia integerrima TaxID=434235 RepID=A0ACC0ZFA1_9ROSI|nr:hypothetical protein Pint_15866 [Pistacia integerrima]